MFIGRGKFLALCLGMIFVAALATGQDPITRLEVSVRTVSLEVGTFDSNGTSIPTLTKEDFVLEENGVRQEIRNFTFLDNPVNLLVLFDQQTSGDKANTTMAQNRGFIARGENWAATQTFVGETIALFMRQLRPDDRIAIAAFDEFSLTNKVVDWRGPSQGRTQVQLFRQYLNAHQPGEKDLYGAIKWGVTELQKQKGRKAIVVFTDGRDGRLFPVRLVTGGDDTRIVFDPLYGAPDLFEEEDFQAMLQVVTKSGIPVHVVAIDSGPKPWELFSSFSDDLPLLFPADPKMEATLKTRVESRLKQLAQDSGGRIYSPKDLSDKFTLHAEISHELFLERLYSLAYVPTNASLDGSYRRINVRINRPNVRVSQSKQGYTAQ
jgi:VWFA-related protein